MSTIGRKKKATVFPLTHKIQPPFLAFSFYFLLVLSIEHFDLLILFFGEERSNEVKYYHYILQCVLQ